MPLLRSKKDTKAVRKSTKKPKKSKKSSKKSSTPARTTKPLNRRSLRNQTTKQSNSKQKTIASSSSSSRSSESGSNNKKRVSKRLASSDSSIEIALSSGSSSAFSSPRLPLQNAKTDKRVKKSEKSGKKDGKKGEKSEKSGKKGEKKGDKSEKISKKAKVEKTTSSPKKSSEKSPSSSPKKSSEKSQKTLQVRTVTGTSSKTIKLARQVLNQVKQQNGLNQLPEAVVIESAVFNPRVTHRKRTPWSPRETRDLMKGVEKYGEGKWALILQDKSFNFHGIRTAVDLKDKYRNMTSYVEYKNRPMRKFVLVDSRHQPILTPSGGQTILNNRIPREAALKIASKDKSYPVDERGNRPDSCLIYLREMGNASKEQIVHVYRGTRTLQPVQGNLTKFAGYNSIWLADVEKLACERLLTAEAVLRSEQEEEQARNQRI